MASLLVLRASATAPAPATSPTPINIVHGTYPQLWAYLTLNIWASHLGIPVLLALTFFCKKIKRHPTFVNLCLVFVVQGISSALLLYAGKTKGPEPSKILCLLQASLLYGYPPMAAVAVFVLVLQMFLVIKAAHEGVAYQEKKHVVRLWLMLIAPWLVFFAGLLTTAVLGVSRPDKVSRNRRFFYCSLELDPWTNTLTVFSAIFFFLTLVYEAWLLFILYKRWTALRATNGNGRSGMDISTPLRIVIFGLYLTLALSLSLLSVRAPHSPVPDVTISTASTVFVLLFGTQRDILRSLCFWRYFGKAEDAKQARYFVTLTLNGKESEEQQKESDLSQLSWPRVPAV